MQEFREEEERNFQGAAYCMKTLLETTSEAFREGTIERRLAMAEDHYRSKSVLEQYSDQFVNQKERALRDELKSERMYRKFSNKDSGYFLTFEHENEVQEFLTRQQSHTLLSNLLGEKDFKVPCFFPFEKLDKICKGHLGPRLFSFSTRASIGLPMGQTLNLDMAMLKRLLLRVSLPLHINFSNSLILCASLSSGRPRAQCGGPRKSISSLGSTLRYIRWWARYQSTDSRGTVT